MKAIWKDIVIAESNDTKIIEGNHYFPPESIKKEFIKKSSTHSICPWKGKASYYDIIVSGEENKDAAWYYPEPKEEAKEIKNHVAFWKGVVIEQ
jgi:uncharacterized protein (DUF427 family)